MNFFTDLTSKTILIFPCILLFIIGCFGLLNSKTIFNSLFSLDVIDTATITTFVIIAAFPGSQTPITGYERYSSYADPYPQAIILTAIVIGFATQALLSGIALRLSRKFPLLRFKDLENDK